MGKFDRKYIPTSEELTDWIRQQSATAYPGQPEWGITASWYESHKPNSWCARQTICRRYKQPFSSEGWAIMVRELTGLMVPTKADIARNTTTRQGGYLPTRDELAQHITVSLNENVTRGISIGAYNKWRPEKWATAESICYFYGIEQTAEAWRNLLYEITGIEIEDARTLSRHPDLDRYPGPLPDGEKEAARSWRDGLEVMREKSIAIMVWNWPTREYVPAGYEQVLILK